MSTDFENWVIQVFVHRCIQSVVGLVNINDPMDANLVFFSPLPRDEQSQYSAFSSLCDGVEFVSLPVAQERGRSSKLAYFQQPTLHTFWTGCSVS